MTAKVPMYNLLVTGAAGAWEKPHYVYELPRFLEYTDDGLRKRLKPLDSRAREKLLALPSLFAYETRAGAPARVGWVTDLHKRDNELRVSFRFDPDQPPVTPERDPSAKAG